MTTIQHLLPVANHLGWRQLGSLWRDPRDGKQWAWTAAHLRAELVARFHPRTSALFIRDGNPHWFLACYVNNPDAASELPFRRGYN